MTAPVDHDQRRREILDQALALFAECGFAGVTFQNLADRCELSRTTIYRYFHDKEQLFSFAIRRLTEQVDENCRRIMESDDSPIDEQLVNVMRAAVDPIFEQQVLLTVIFEYLLHVKQLGGEIRQKVRRHTIGMKVLVKHLIRQGINDRQLRSVNPEIAASLLYGVLESAILQLAVTDMADHQLINQQIQLVVDCLKIDSPSTN